MQAFFNRMPKIQGGKKVISHSCTGAEIMLDLFEPVLLIHDFLFRVP